MTHIQIEGPITRAAGREEAQKIFLKQAGRANGKAAELMGPSIMTQGKCRYLNSNPGRVGGDTLILAHGTRQL